MSFRDNLRFFETLAASHMVCLPRLRRSNRGLIDAFPFAVGEAPSIVSW